MTMYGNDSIATATQIKTTNPTNTTENQEHSVGTPSYTTDSYSCPPGTRHNTACGKQCYTQKQIDDCLAGIKNSQIEMGKTINSLKNNSLENNF